MGERAKAKRRLVEAYEYPGFRARSAICEAVGDRGTLIVSLERRSKKHGAAAAVRVAGVGMTVGVGAFAIWDAAGTGLFWNLPRTVWTVLAAAG
jgi:hypothetical protein